MTKSILGISRNNLAGDAVQHILSIGNPLQNLPVSAIIDFLLYGDAVFCEPLHMLCIVVQLEGTTAALQRYSATVGNQGNKYTRGRFPCVFGNVLTFPNFETLFLRSYFLTSYFKPIFYVPREGGQ